MNRISLIMNVVLTIAVAVLFFLHFQMHKQVITTSHGPSHNDSLVKTIPTTKAQQESGIVYLNIDTLKEKYDYFRIVKKEYETTIIQYETSMQSKYESLQADYNNYIESQGAGLTKEQMIAKEADFQKRKEDLDKLQANKAAYEEKAGEKLEAVQKKLNAFFKAFTKANGYSCILVYTVHGDGALGIDDRLDVTEHVVKGLNDEYQLELKNKPDPKKK